MNPGATETWYDGVDTDCDGAGDYDADADGHDHDAYGGDDCDDTDGTINPSEAETWYDGLDSDCDGASDYDADGDGHDHDTYAGDDCDDTDPTVSPSASEVRDGQDNDCNEACDEGLISAGDLIVTEVMKDPSKVSDSLGEWFEVTNTTTTDILMCADWAFEDDDTDAFSLPGGQTVYVPAGGSAILARDDDPTTNGGVTADYAFASGMQLANGADELALIHGLSTIDHIAWDDGVTWPDTTGSSLSLSPTATDGTSNDDGANWCSGSSTYGDGDKGTPGDANDGC